MTATIAVTRALFPSRLMRKIPTWTHAKMDVSCSWCQDDIDQGEQIVLDNEKHLTLCLECGGSYMKDVKGTSIPIPNQLDQNIASSKKLQRLENTHNYLALQIQDAIDNHKRKFSSEFKGR